MPADTGAKFEAKMDKWMDKKMKGSADFLPATCPGPKPLFVCMQCPLRLVYVFAYVGGKKRESYEQKNRDRGSEWQDMWRGMFALLCSVLSWTKRREENGDMAAGRDLEVNAGDATKFKTL